VALDPLITTADLDARGIVSGFLQVDTFIAEASTVVREAAGTPISEVTSTVTLDGYRNEQWLELPGSPVTAVATVTIDGDTVTDWRLASGRLWRAASWGSGGRWGYDDRPSAVSVTYTHGLPTVPEDIVGLVCAMVAASKAALDEDDDGLGLALDNGRVQSVRIDGFAETYGTSQEAIAAATRMTLPERTRQMLQARFSGSATSLRSR